MEVVVVDDTTIDFEVSWLEEEEEEEDSTCSEVCCSLEEEEEDEDSAEAAMERILVAHLTSADGTLP